MLFELFVVGSIWFWLLVAIEAVAIVSFVANEKSWGATASLLVFLALLWLLGDFNILAYIRQNPLQALTVLGVYFGAGVAWGYIKWWGYVAKSREKYDSLRASFLEEKRIAGGVIPYDKREDFVRHLRNGYEAFADLPLYDLDRTVSNIAPRIRNNKGLVISWMSYWPFSLFWTVFHDAIRKAWNVLYLRIANSLQVISDRQYKGIDQHFAPQPPPQNRSGSTDVRS